MDADGLFLEFSKTFEENLLILVHIVAMVNHRKIINGGSHWNLDKEQKIHSVEKRRLHQCLQLVFFALYALNVGPV